MAAANEEQLKSQIETPEKTVKRKNSKLLSRTY